MAANCESQLAAGFVVAVGGPDASIAASGLGGWDDVGPDGASAACQFPGNNISRGARSFDA